MSQPTVGIPNAAIDREALAVLLWDFFGPKLPKLSEARILGSRPATSREIANYRTCAAFIISSLKADTGMKGDGQYWCACVRCDAPFWGGKYAVACPDCASGEGK